MQSAFSKKETRNSLRHFPTFLATLLLCLSFNQLVNAASVSISFAGIIGGTVGYNAEPYIGIGDGYSGTLNFDVDEADSVTNVGGNVVVNGTATTFTGYGGAAVPKNDSTAFRFDIDPFGDGAGGNNVEAFEFLLGSVSAPFGGLYDIITAGNANFFGIYILAMQPGQGELDISLNLSSSIDGSFDVDISAVPLPAALPLYGAGMAIIGFIGWRRKQKRL